MRRAGIVVFGGICAGTACLGVWQTKRYFWKVDLLEQISDGLKHDPVPLPTYTNISSVIDDLVSVGRGRRICVRGTFDHSNEVLLGPRTPPPDLVTKQAQGLSTNPQGYYVLTPFKTTDGHTIIINRGWVPRSMREWARPVGVCEVRGVYAPAEKRGRFSPENDLTSNKLLWLEQEAISSKVFNRTDAPVLIIEVVEPDEVKVDGFPVSKRVKHVLYGGLHTTPATHAAYAFTWFTLAAFGVAMTYSKFRRP